MALQTLYANKLDPDSFAGVPVNLGGIISQNIFTDTEVRQEATSGGVYALWQSLYAGAPGARMQTYSLKRALDAIGTTGLAIAATTGTGVTMYAYKKQEGGTRASGSVHTSYNVKEGMVVPRSISVDHQGDARLNYDVIATYDGTNAPMVASNTAAVPTGILDDQRYSIGAVQLGTGAGDKIVLTQIQSIEFDFGLNVVANSFDSDIYPTIVTIDSIERPVIRIVTSDLSRFAGTNGIPLEGKDIDSSHTVIFLRKRARLTSSGYVADATTEHIKIVPLVGCAYHTDLGNHGSSSANGTATIEIPMISDGTNAPWTWTMGAAISLP